MTADVRLRARPRHLTSRAPKARERSVFHNTPTAALQALKPDSALPTDTVVEAHTGPLFRGSAHISRGSFLWACAQGLGRRTLRSCFGGGGLLAGLAGCAGVPQVGMKDAARIAAAPPSGAIRATLPLARALGSPCLLTELRKWFRQGAPQSSTGAVGHLFK